MRGTVGLTIFTLILIAAAQATGTSEPRNPEATDQYFS
jgi:hypothetical protein